MKNQEYLSQISREREQGNVLIIVLITIALMAALSFSVLRSNQGGDKLLTAGEAKITASNILKATKSIENAVKSLQFTNGCSGDDVSFENNLVAGYTNAGAPADNSCHVFEQNGGGLNYSAPPEKSLNVSEDWIFSGAHLIEGIGSAVGDLTMYLREVKDPVCLELNRMLGITTPTTIPADATAVTLTKFTGTFANDAAPNDDEVRTQNKKTACVNLTASGHNVFYHTLIMR